jgi:hypothetical protein
MERPVCCLGGLSAKSDEAVIYGNVVFLEHLRDLITKMLANGESRASIPVTKGHDWNMLRVEVCVPADFETGPACRCGCQDKFKDIEEKYAALP